MNGVCKFCQAKRIFLIVDRSTFLQSSPRSSSRSFATRVSVIRAGSYSEELVKTALYCRGHYYNKPTTITSGYYIPMGTRTRSHKTRNSSLNLEHIPVQVKDDKKKPFRSSPRTPEILISFHPDQSEFGQQSPEDVHGEGEAIETLSISISCNYIEQNSEAECSTSFCSDFQTRDYLMNLFLPAVKLMIIETPQNIAKRQEATILAPLRYVKKVYNGDLRPLVNSYNHEDIGSIVVDNVDDVKKKLRKKGFRFFLPRTCTKRKQRFTRSSLLLLSLMDLCHGCCEELHTVDH